MLHRLFLILSLNALTACSSLAQNTSDFIVLQELQLGIELQETSALYCPEAASAYTVNDSGNKPIIYKIDENGKVIDRQTIDIKNRDWESLSGDADNFYIGDVGNNNGKQKFVQIHTVDKSKGHKLKNSIKINYVDNSIKKNEYLNHDFDAESIVSMGENIYLFSKSWRTTTLHIYRLERDVLEQNIKPLVSLQGLPGIVTGGDYDAKNERFIIVGYELKGLGRFYPFITILDKEFQLVKSFLLKDYAQVEGICVTPTGETWLTQEGYFFSPQKLVKLKIY